VILETKNPRSITNWGIGIVVASDNAIAVKRAVTMVQKRLQTKYRLRLMKRNPFEIGDRVHLSELGKSRIRSRSPIGTIVGLGGQRASAESVRVKFDDRRTARRLHFTYLEAIAPTTGESHEKGD
jgi:hypothetical protein